MKPSLKLLEKAKAASPPTDSNKWSPLMPIVETLLSQNFTLTQAVKWLQAEKAIPNDAKVYRSAYHSFSGRLRRKKSPAIQTTTTTATPHANDP